MELLDEMVKRELREEVRGKEGNALFIGPKNRVNEMTHATQRMTRGSYFGKRDRRDRPTNSFASRGICKTVSVKRCTPFRNRHVAFPLENEINTEGQPMILRHVAHKGKPM